MMQLISTGQYIPGVTDEELGKKWGVQAVQVQHIASDAARYLRIAVEANDIVMETLKGALHTIRVAAMQKGKYRDAVAAIQTHLGLVGKIEERVQDEKERAKSGDGMIDLSAVVAARAAAEANERETADEPLPEPEAP